ncbi:MAG TPA: endonuclease/exonuclease/phosphatase family protein [Candidatus Limnocylindrales bacterium]|nr:endonuclease/exonuclease/phosphatase family protein [Candidatus Limnocylindrales bacterium]
MTARRFCRAGRAGALAAAAFFLTLPGATAGRAIDAGSGRAAICDHAQRPWLTEPDAGTGGAHSKEQTGAADAGVMVARVLGPRDAASALAPDVLETASRSAAVGAAPALRVVTYNIHSGLGEKHALRRAREEVEANLRVIARDIAGGSAEPADVVALNEVDFDSRRSAGIDQAAFMAAELERISGHAYGVVRGETWRRSFPGLDVRFGNALLTRLPIVSASACLLTDDGECEAAAAAAELPSLRIGGWRSLLSERRGVIKATVRAADRDVDVLVTHLDPFHAAARERQALHILRRFIDPARTTLLLGDLNAVSTSLTGKRRFFASDRTMDILTSDTLADVRVSYAAEHGLDSLNRWPTYPAAAPQWPLDAVLASVDLAARDIRVIGSTASDHRGLTANLTLIGGAGLAERRARHDRIRERQLERIVHCDLAGGDSSREWLVAMTGFRALLATAQAGRDASAVATLSGAAGAEPVAATSLPLYAGHVDRLIAARAADSAEHAIQPQSTRMPVRDPSAAGARRAPLL